MLSEVPEMSALGGKKLDGNSTESFWIRPWLISAVIREGLIHKAPSWCPKEHIFQEPSPEYSLEYIFLGGYENPQALPINSFCTAHTEQVEVKDKCSEKKTRAETPGLMEGVHITHTEESYLTSCTPGSGQHKEGI